MAEEEKAERTAEDQAAIEFLNELRECPGEEHPSGLPLACVVKVLETVDVPKANDAYAMVRVEGADGRTWRMCVYRKSVKAGKNALFVSELAALPDQPRFCNPAVCTVKRKKYKYGHGITATRLLPHVKRHVYRNNCGVLFPMEAFPELKGRRVGMVVAVLLRIDNQEELKALQQQPRYVSVFRP